MNRSPQADVLVVGGYGAVGSIVTREVALRTPGHVIVSGRDLVAAESLARRFDNARAVHLDLADPRSLARVLDEFPVKVVVLAVEPDNAEPARMCVERGVHVIDVSASAGLLTQTEQLHDLAVKHDATALLSVGLAPGLTNVLARRALDSLPESRRIDITILLGGGEKHGKDAIRWTIRQLQAPSPDTKARSLKVWLPGFGVRRAHPFPFSDQITLRRTLPIAQASTRMCFDSATVTALIFGARRAGVFRLARGPRTLAALTALFGGVHAGSDRYVVRVDAQDAEGQHAWHAVTGNRQSLATGLAAAAATAQLLTDELPPGVHHLDQLHQFHQLPEDLAPAVQVWSGSPRPNLSLDPYVSGWPGRAGCG